MNNLPMKIEEDGFFQRIIKWIKSFFRRDKVVSENSKIEPKEQKRTIMMSYKVKNLENVNSEIIRRNNQRRTLEEIIQIIEKHPSSLWNLDIRKLKLIDNYYKEEIQKYKKKLEKMPNN